MSALIGWAMSRRDRLPRWAARAIEAPAADPDSVFGRLGSRLFGGREAQVTAVPATPVRVYIAPTNYAGQGYRWARALEAADSAIGARNMAVALPGGFRFPADTNVSLGVVNSSTDWAQQQWSAVARFTHVLVEAERPLFGRLFGRRLVDEIAALREAGVNIALLAHGTDVRDPERHRTLTPWSPYPDDPRTPQLMSAARQNVRLLADLALPTFVSTPDLLGDVPWAQWCPVVVDPGQFATTAPAFERSRPRVIHASSAPLQKGSHLLAPALSALTATGRIDFEAIPSTPASDMPRVFAASDIVLDQFRLGSYGVAACEAMAAGRVVVGHVLPSVREHVARITGLELPIIEATPDTLADVVGELADDRDRARVAAAAGPVFVTEVHSGSASARVLLDEWIGRG